MFADDAEADTAAAIRDFQPDLIGLSIRNLDNQSYFNPVWNLPAVRALIRRIRAENRRHRPSRRPRLQHPARRMPRLRRRRHRHSRRRRRAIRHPHRAPRRPRRLPRHPRHRLSRQPRRAHRRRPPRRRSCRIPRRHNRNRGQIRLRLPQAPTPRPAGHARLQRLRIRRWRHHQTRPGILPHAPAHPLTAATGASARPPKSWTKSAPSTTTTASTKSSS